MIRVPVTDAHVAGKDSLNSRPVMIAATATPKPIVAAICAGWLAHWCRATHCIPGSVMAMHPANHGLYVTCRPVRRPSGGNLNGARGCSAGIRV